MTGISTVARAKLRSEEKRIAGGFRVRRHTYEEPGFTMAEPFGSLAALKNQGLLTPESNTHFRVERNFLISLMAKRLANIKFDEAWYLSKYPDVREAVRRGVFASGRDHYVLSGYYEHRMPAAIVVNEKWYLEAYPDVAEAMKAGVYKSGQAHFDLAGFREGRMPYANFQL